MITEQQRQFYQRENTRYLAKQKMFKPHYVWRLARVPLGIAGVLSVFYLIFWR